MELDGPFYMKEFIYNNHIFKEFISGSNVKLLLEIIYDFSLKNNFKLCQNDETTTKLIGIISYFGKEIINDYLIFESDDSTPMESPSLIVINKKMLKNVIIFLRQYSDNLDVFSVYVKDLYHRAHLQERKQLDSQLLQPVPSIPELGINSTIASSSMRHGTEPTLIINNDFIHSHTEENAIQETQTLQSLKNQINHLTKKYPSGVLDNIVIESVKEPGKKYVIEKLTEAEDYDITKLSELSKAETPEEEEPSDSLNCLLRLTPQDDTSTQFIFDAFKSVFHYFQTKHHKENVDFVLEPLQSMVQVCLLSFCPVGTMLTIDDGLLCIQKESNSSNDKSHDNVYFLLNVFRRFLIYYEFIKESNGELYRLLMHYSQLGLDKLIQTYSDDDKALVRYSLKMYKVMLKNSCFFNILNDDYYEDREDNCACELKTKFDDAFREITKLYKQDYLMLYENILNFVVSNGDATESTIEGIRVIFRPVNEKIKKWIHQYSVS